MKNLPGVIDDATRLVPLASLKPWEKNPRKIPDEAIDAVARSISAGVWTSPIVARPDGTILAGHTRRLAALKLGLAEVPVRFVEVTDDQFEQLVLADNRTGEIAEWDDGKLSALLESLAERNVAAFEATAFSDRERRELLARLEASRKSGTSEDATPALPTGEPESKLGEVYELGPHRLMCGDSTNPEHVALLMRGERAVMMATDPPYLVDYDGNNHPQGWQNKLKGVDPNKKGGWDAYKDPETSVTFFASFIRAALEVALVERPAIYQWYASRVHVLVEEAWRKNALFAHQQIIWVKSRPILTRSHFMWQHEPCLYGWVDGKQFAKDRRPPASGDATTVWTIPIENEGIHLTQKPIEVFTRPIDYHTKPGELVYEPFGGSGTQVIAADKRGRRCYAMELSPAFVDVIRKRWANWVAKTGGTP